MSSNEVRGKRRLIFDDNKIRNCENNIAKLNIFQWLYYFGIKELKIFLLFGCNDLSEFFEKTMEVLLILMSVVFFPILIPLKGFLAIRRARKSVRVWLSSNDNIQNTNNEIEKMAMEKWNKEADEWNQWTALSEEEKSELIFKEYKIKKEGESE